MSDLSETAESLVLDLLAEGERAGAILVAVRATNVEPAEAWKTVRAIMVAVDEPGFLPEKGKDEYSVDEVETYLTGDRGSSRQTSLIAYGIATIFLLIATYFLAHYGQQLVRRIRSFWWPSIDATVVKVRHYSFRTRVERPATYYQDFQYRYKLGDRTYTGEEIRDHYSELFGEKAFHVGDQVTVVYDPDDPSRAIYNRYLYYKSMGVLFGMAMLLVAGLSVAFGRSRGSIFRRLERVESRWTEATQAVSG